MIIEDFTVQVTIQRDQRPLIYRIICYTQMKEGKRLKVHKISSYEIDSISVYPDGSQQHILNQPMRDAHFHAMMSRR